MVRIGIGCNGDLDQWDGSGKGKKGNFRAMWLRLSDK